MTALVQLRLTTGDVVCLDPTEVASVAPYEHFLPQSLHARLSGKRPDSVPRIEVTLKNRKKYQLNYETVPWVMKLLYPKTTLQEVEDYELEERGLYVRISCSPEDIKDEATREKAKKLFAILGL